MKNNLQFFALLLLLVSNVAFGSCCNTASSCSTDSCCASTLTAASDVRTVFIPRSVGANTARELVGWQQAVQLHDYAAVGDGCYDWNGAAAVALEYSRSFRSNCITNSLFAGNTLSFAGSLVADRTASELVADNFGLSQNFRGSLTFSPRITNVIADFEFFWDISTWLYDGFWFRLHAPVAHTKWELNVCETNNGSVTPFSVSSGPVLASGALTQTTSTCYMGGTSTTPVANILTALSGEATFGGLTSAICGGQINNCSSNKKTRLADLDLILGYDFIRCDNYHLGAFLMAVAPTGNRPDAQYLFSPVVGNGHHWEFGGGLSAHLSFWECDNSEFGLFFEGNVTHMFKDTQCRLFDLCPNGAFSRYALLLGYAANGVTPNGSITSATCFATREVSVSRAVKGDASFKFAYRRCNWEFDLGWNIYGHSAEKLSLKNGSGCCSVTPAGRYAVKGVSAVNGLPYAFSTVAPYPITIAGVPAVTPARRSLSCANMFEVSQACNLDNNGGLPCPDTTQTEADFIAATVNAGSPLLVSCSSPLTTQSTLSLLFNDPIAQPLAQSTPAVLLADCNINLKSGASPATFTNKIFGHINYGWEACRVNPFVGVGAEAEFGKCSCADACNVNGCTPCTGIQTGANQNCTTAASSCSSDCGSSVKGSGVKANLNQWGVWIKGGIVF